MLKSEPVNFLQAHKLNSFIFQGKVLYGRWIWCLLYIITIIPPDSLLYLSMTVGDLCAPMCPTPFWDIVGRDDQTDVGTVFSQTPKPGQELGSKQNPQN